MVRSLPSVFLRVFDLRFSKIRYSWRALAGDLMGGAIAALIAIPYGLALARMMGLPPELGLLTSVATAPITALLGRNPVLIGGTASATVPFLAHATSHGGIGEAAKVCMAASVFMMVFSLLRLGRHIQRVPQSVVTGFSCGIGAMMFLSQLAAMLGIHAAVNRTSNNMLAQSWLVLSRIGEARWEPIVVSTVLIGAALAAQKWLPRWPAPLVGLLAAAAITVLLPIHVREVGAIRLRLPPFAGFSWKPEDMFAVLPAALGLAFVSSINILLTSRVVEHFRGRHKHLKRADADAELGAYGIANLFAASFAAPLSVGIPARSLASVRCGGSTRMSNFLHGVMIVAMIALGGGLIAKIPLVALAAVTAYIGICLLEWSTWKRLPRMRRADAAAFLLTALAVVTVNAVLAVAIGCLCYLPSFLAKRLRRGSPERLGQPAAV
jgi:SulP family sulfate permease